VPEEDGVATAGCKADPVGDAAADVAAGGEAVVVEITGLATAVDEEAEEHPATPTPATTAAAPTAATRLAKQQTAPGKPVAILDIGGYAATATIVCRTPAGFAVTGTPAVSDRLGGEQVDQLIIDHLGRGAPCAHPDWGNLLDPPDERWRQAALDLRGAVRTAKEQLSGRMAAQVALPALDMEVQLTRSELELMLLPVADEAIDLLTAATAAFIRLM